MGLITINLSVEEERTFNQYAKFHAMSLSDLFKQALEEKIENEIDMKIIKDYEERVKNGTDDSKSFDEVKKILDL